MDIDAYASLRKTVRTDFGEISYVEVGEGPAALFVHGAFLNGVLWRHVIEDLRGERRCIAVDLLAHGTTTTAQEVTVAFDTQVEMLGAFCDALGLSSVDIVGNDSGSAMTQLFTVEDPSRVRTMTITNGDVHTNFPPEAFAPVVELARQGQLAPALGEMTRNLDFARSQAGLGSGLERPDEMPAEVVLAYLGRYATDAAQKEIEGFIAGIHNDVLVRIEDDLRKLTVPTLVVWANADQFFDVEWAYWLRDTIPGVTDVVELDGAKLFFPEERPSDLAALLRKHWGAHPA